jgi:predicted GIY-YIG superfamily endonuclease
VECPKTPPKQALRWAAPNVRTEIHPGDYTVYILTNQRRTVLYIGITNEPETRLSQHLSQGTVFTRQYNASVLIYYEHYSDASQAIAREKQLKGWTRAKKVALIRTLNPELRDLGREFYPDLVADVRNKSLVNPRGPSTARPATPGRSAQDDFKGGAS